MNSLLQTVRTQEKHSSQQEQRAEVDGSKKVDDHGVYIDLAKDELQEIRDWINLSNARERSLREKIDELSSLGPQEASPNSPCIHCEGGLRVSELEEQIVQLNNQIRELRKSKTYRTGRAIRESRTISSLFTLPARLYSVLNERS